MSDRFKDGWFAAWIAAELGRELIGFEFPHGTAWAEADAHCPCCDGDEACDPYCTFVDDCPTEHELQVRARALLVPLRRAEAAMRQP